MDCRDKCLARRHDRHLFGDMTDTFALGQVDVCDFVGSEEDGVLAFGCARPDGEAFAAEGFRDFPELPFEADIGFGGADAANDFTVVVFDLWRVLGHGAVARSIAAGRYLLIESLMWPVEIVDRSPAIKCVLDFGKIAEASECEHFGLKRAMEAFALAAALWVPSFKSHTPNRVQRCPDESPQGVPLSTKKASGMP